MRPRERAAGGRGAGSSLRADRRRGGGAIRDTLAALQGEVVSCSRCPRLRDHGATVARVKRAAYRDEEYWGRPVPGFGDPRARILLVGLAPGAHGAHRTGRIFTGDRSGDFLFAALHRAGLANQPTSRRRDDGLRLRGAWVTAAARCAPPGNRPSPAELLACRSFLAREVRLLTRVRVIVSLGAIAFEATWKVLEAIGSAHPKPRPRFGHGVVVEAEGRRPAVVASYHPSQQNTQTGRLTPEMLDAALHLAVERAGFESGLDG